MRSALIAGIAFILAVGSLGAGYAIGNATSHTETTTSTATVTVTSSGNPWTVIVQNGTFTGPGCPAPAQVFMALRIQCLFYTNSSTWYASLLLYNSKYFYAATQKVGQLNSTIATTYTVWFDNSTAYCVSPYFSISNLPTCPPP
jgi:ABC-type transport system substrate-binding protein